MSALILLFLQSGEVSLLDVRDMLAVQDKRFGHVSYVSAAVMQAYLHALLSVPAPFATYCCSRTVLFLPADRIIEGLIEHNMSSYQSGMDSVRNLTGSPIAGIDPHELLDTR